MAANQVGQVEIRIVPDGSQFGPQLQAILDAAAGKASAAGKAIGQGIGQGTVPQVQAVSRSMMDMNVQFDNALRKAGVFTAEVMGAKFAIEKVVGKLAGLYDQLAQAQAGFTAIIGSRKGGLLLDEIRQFAKESPFVTQQLVNYSQQLLGVGMAADKIVPLLKDTGNVISSVGGDTSNLGRVLYAFSQIQTVGRLMGQDAMQLQASLIPITKMLASYLGKTTQEVKKLQEQGRISSEQVFAAISAAGQKVPRAMDNAVRNIAGARAVLSDTITILLQDAPALRNVYDDIVKGIQTVAKVLSSDEVTGAISRAFEQVGTVYDTLKPVIQEFIASVGEGSFSALKIFTEMLGVFSTVLGSIPESALQLLAKTLASIALLKAPMMLGRYVKQFMDMAAIFSSEALPIALQKTVTSIANTEGPTRNLTVANEQLARSYRDVTSAAAGAAANIGSAAATEAVSAATGARGGWIGRKISAMSPTAKRLAGGAALMVGGQVVSSMAGEESVAGQSIGGALQGASLGAMYGGPWGAAAGAAVGGMMSFFSAQKAAAEKHRKDMEEMGQKTAQDYIDAQDKMFGTGVSARKLAAYETRLSQLSSQLTKEYATQSARMRAQYIAETTGYGTRANLPNDATQIRAILTQASSNQRIAAEAQAYVESQIGTNYTGLKDDTSLNLLAQQRALNEEFAPIREDLLSKLSGAGRALSPEEQATFSGRTGGLYQMVGGLAGGAQGYAVNANATISQIQKVYEVYGLSLTQAANLTEEETTRIITTIEKIPTAMQDAAKSASQFVNAYEEGSRAAETMYGNQSKVLGYELKTIGELKSATDAVTKAFQNQGDESAQLAAKQAVFQAQQAVYALEYAKTLNNLKLQGVDTITATQKAEEIALKASVQVIKEMSVLSVKSIADMAKTYGYSTDEMQKLLGLQGKIDKDMKITVTVAIDEAMKKLAALNSAIEIIGRNLDNVYKYGGTGNFAMNFKKIESLGVSAAQAKKYISDQVERQTGAKAGGGGGGQSFEDKVKSAASALENSIKSAMESVKGAAEAWKATIKQRVQYEEAVGVGRAIRNAQRQATDISFLTTGIAQLKARGLTEEALTALDINAITDVRQVKRLLSSSPEELTRLSTAVSQRDKLASTLASDRQQEQNRKTITQAILEAARILGYKFTEEQAKAISAEFNITTETDAKRMIEDILRALSGGKITSVPTT